MLYRDKVFFNRKGFPKLTGLDKKPAIYFLFNSSLKWIYVGATRNLYNRMRSHSGGKYRDIVRAGLFSYLYLSDKRTAEMYEATVLMKARKRLQNVQYGNAPIDNASYRMRRVFLAMEAAEAAMVDLRKELELAKSLGWAKY